MSQRSTLSIFFIGALIVCAFDVYSAVRGQGGHSAVAWTLAGVMAVVALLALRKLLRGDYSGSWW